MTQDYEKKSNSKQCNSCDSRNAIEIIEGDMDDLEDIYDSYTKDFASDERKEFDHLRMLMEKKKYKLLLGRHRILNDTIGYAFLFEAYYGKILWLDYIAIMEKFRNAGYGTLLFEKIAEFRQDTTLGVLLEVEKPDSNNEDIKRNQLRRIKFYERLGARKLHIDYKLPTATGGFPMDLYFKPSPGVRILPKEVIQEVIASVFDYIHTDVYGRDMILNSILATVNNEYFN